MHKSSDQGTLYDRTQGPNAVPVLQLIVRAELAATGVKRDYLPFLMSQLPKLATIFSQAAVGAHAADCWKDLNLAIHDLRSSSASAGYDQVSAVASSLEWLLAEAADKNLRVAEIVRLHLAALHQLVRAAPPPMGSPEVQELLAGLGRASYQATRAARSA